MCCPDTDDGSSTSIGFPSKVSTRTLGPAGSEERTLKSCRALWQQAHAVRGRGRGGAGIPQTFFGFELRLLKAPDVEEADMLPSIVTSACLQNESDAPVLLRNFFSYHELRYRSIQG